MITTMAFPVFDEHDHDLFMNYFRLSAISTTRSYCRRVHPCFISKRNISKEALEEKYGAKVKQRLEQQGLSSIEEYKNLMKRQTKPDKPSVHHQGSVGLKQNDIKLKKNTNPSKGRKDEPPVRPLSSIINLSKLFATPHTKEQVGALWTGHHASRPGHLSAVISTDVYKQILHRAARYPTFVLPLPRKSTPLTEGQSQEEPAYEFHYTQWSLYESPSDPRTIPEFPFEPPVSPLPDTAEPNPRTSVALFTALAEYKLHQSFATPHLVLTHYTDLVNSHGIVLLRGEITPSSSDPTRFRINASDAQILALSMQKFYLGEDHEQGPKLLTKFHESPSEFRWEDVVQVCDFGAAV